MKPEYEYRECLQCSHIEDCPHPDVDEKGRPKPPDVCVKKDEIILTKRS